MIRQVGEGIYEVPSGTSHGKHYVVNLTHAGRPECTCTNWAVQRNKRKSQGQAPDPYECKHVREALRADPNLLKKQRAEEAEAYRQRDAEAKAEQQAKADKMKAELMKMRAELHGESPALKPKPEPVAEVQDVRAQFDEERHVVKPVNERTSFAKMLKTVAAAPFVETPTPTDNLATEIVHEAFETPVAKKPRRTAARVEAEEKAAAGDLMAQLEAAIIAQKQGAVTVVCPTEPDPANGAEGCGETFTAVPDEDYVECPSCGLAFDVTRAKALESM